MALQRDGRRIRGTRGFLNLMQQERWNRVEQLFFAAAELQGAEREHFVRAECGEDSALREEVLALLVSDSQASDFLRQNFKQSVIAFSEQTELPRTLRAGPYRLTTLLGRGGMGAVYLGQRDDGQYQGQVAVKLVHPGMDTGFFMERFKRERQALARLQHPNIARLLDSGTAADGVPFIAMDLVDGIPINQFCRNHALDVPDILILFRQVCDAVAHAHRNFIVHRDLKPGNILIERSGTPKLLDFGICKLLVTETSAGDTVETTHMMTPDYASPEQVLGEPVNISSDIYSLGAILYELLAGVRPHHIDKMTTQAIAKAVCEDEVASPSRAAPPALARQLRGDLDNILLKALQKDPVRRYPSVESFSDDLRRVLDSEPVMARPDTAFYRASKFVRRNRAVAAITALLIISLSAGLAGYARQAFLARRSAAESRALANAILFDIHDQVSELPGSLKARQNIVRIGLSYLDRLAAGAGSDEALGLDLAGAYLRMGEILGGVSGSYTGDTEKALASFRSALSALESLPSSAQAIRLRMDIHNRIGQLFDSRGSSESITHFDLGIHAAGTRSEPAILQSLAALYSAKARSLRKLERRTPALEASLRADSLFKSLVAANPAENSLRGDLASSSVSTATLLRSFNKLPEARRDLEAAVAQWDELVRREPANATFQRNRMLAYSHLGDVLGNPSFQNLGDTANARMAFDSMLDAAKKQYDASPGDQGATIDYGMALGRVAALPLADPSARLEMFAQSARMLEAAIRRDPAQKSVPGNLASYRELEGDLLAGLGRMDQARRAWRHALDVLDRTKASLPGASRVRISVLQKLAEDAAHRSDATQALSLARQAVEYASRANAPPSPSVSIRMLEPRAWAALGSVHHILGHTADARVWLRRALGEAQVLSTQPGFPAEHKKFVLAVQTLLATVSQ